MRTSLTGLAAVKVISSLSALKMGGCCLATKGANEGAFITVRSVKHVIKMLNKLEHDHKIKKLNIAVIAEKATLLFAKHTLTPFMVVTQADEQYVNVSGRGVDYLNGFLTLPSEDGGFGGSRNGEDDYTIPVKTDQLQQMKEDLKDLAQEWGWDFCDFESRIEH